MYMYRYIVIYIVKISHLHQPSGMYDIRISENSSGDGGEGVSADVIWRKYVTIRKREKRENVKEKGTIPKMEN